ncbi:MAG: hypothetical protein AAFU61_15950, partial [Pseudomonadota bacterium]
SAALTLLESLLIVLQERQVLDAADVDEIFETAIEAHRRDGDDVGVGGGGGDGEGAGDGDGPGRRDADEVVRLLRRLHVRGGGIGGGDDGGGDGTGAGGAGGGGIGGSDGSGDDAGDGPSDAGGS